MAEEETEVEQQPAAVPAAPPRAGRLGPILQVVNTVVLVAVLVLQVVRPGGLRHDARAEERHGGAERREAADRAPPESKESQPKETQPGPTMRLSDFVVHLRDPDADRYARISFEMEVRDEKAKEVVTARMPQIRDAFLAYLSDRSSEEFRGSEAIGQVKAALMQKLTGVAPSAGVRALYITELVVQ